MQARRSAALKTFPVRPLPRHLIERQVRSRPLHPGALSLKLLHFATLIRLSATVSPATVKIVHLGRPDGSNCVRNASALGRQHVHVAELIDDVLGGESLHWHPVLLLHVRRHNFRWTS